MTLEEYFATIPDFRRKQGIRFPLPALLTMITLGVMSGHYAYRELSTFMRANAEELRELLGISREQMPSHVTIRTVFRNVDPDQLQSVFNQWCTETFGIEAGERAAIDGKALGSTVTNANNSEQDFVMMVSAFVHNRQQVIGVGTFDNGKAGEGEAVRELLKTLKLEKAHLTLDALHCQKKTLGQINEEGNEYTVQLKKNCPKLFAQAEELSESDEAYSLDEQHQRQKGREESRIVHCFAWTAPLDDGWQAAEIATLIVVDRRTYREGNWQENRHFYLSNVANQSASVAAEIIRGHWSVENGLHWPKDVIQKEDEATISESNPAESLSLFKSMAINLYRQHGYRSVKNAIISLANKPKQLLDMIRI